MNSINVYNIYAVFCSLCFLPVSWVLNVASVSALFIFDYHFGFLYCLLLCTCISKWHTPMSVVTVVTVIVW